MVFAYRVVYRWTVAWQYSRNAWALVPSPICSSACLLVSQLLWLCGFPWSVQGALRSSSSTGSVGALSWGTDVFWICKLVFPDSFHTAPHTLFCLITELLVCPAPIFMHCLCTVITGRVLQNGLNFWMFSTSLTVLHSWCYYFTDWNILWCFKEPLFHYKFPLFQWLFMYLK